MIDLLKLEQYTENNRIEAKKALGGLPHSIWETYSAFANTLGGVILLGVEEYRDKSFHTVNLPDPEGMVKEFWELVNDPNKASVNILTSKQVRIETVNGDRIIVIEVPRAQRSDRPVYIDRDPVSGSYIRNGEGDYRCTKEELRAMYRDAELRTQDMLVLENETLSAFCADTILAYRKRMRRTRPNHAWEDLPDEDFLVKLGAMGLGKDGGMHPTAAGMLMFGRLTGILKLYPEYYLDYRVEADDTNEWTDRVSTASGTWSGNVLDFYFLVSSKLKLFPDGSPINKAVGEALANCLINADYYGQKGLIILRKKNLIIMSNPGDFRVDLTAARDGGLSDPRNGVLMKMFNLIDVSSQTGSGIPDILYAWKMQGWSEPTIIQSFDPNRVQLSLPLTKTAEKRNFVKHAENRDLIEASAQKDMIISYLTEHISAGADELCTLLNVKAPRVSALLSELIGEEIVTVRDDGGAAVYKLKA